jgi:hypothetical protein
MRQPPRDIAGRSKVYAYERSLGISPDEACRRAGGKVAAGDAVKWEHNKRVQAWIAYFRSLGFTAEALAAAEAQEDGFFDLARLINSVLQPAPLPKMEDAAFNATWETPRGPVFYSSWIFRCTASFSTSPWPLRPEGDL